MAHLFDNHPDDAVFETRPAPRRSRTIVFGVAAIVLVFPAVFYVVYRVYSSRPRAQVA